ncbi:MAG: glycosyltransferase family 2 protein [Planctomycetes bacterium]|nr:glycosyltransferase family 2 protein [Planctomycetota bacterium]
MYKGKSISFVVPAYNEEKLVGPTIESVPDYIDKIYVVDDCSPDNQNAVVEKYQLKDERVVLLKHTENQGPGGAVITGYLQSSKDNIDIAVVGGGDNQFPLNEIPNLLEPILAGECDCAKGNRFLMSCFDDTWGKMPKIRFYANWIITALTKIASGYYKTMDVVDGFTAITKQSIDTIDWNNAWKQYGYPMSFLIVLNAYGKRIKEIPRTAVYTPGERQSQIKGVNYALKVSPMLLRSFLWRLRFKYLYRDFHPLVFFYFLSFVLLPTGLALGFYLFFDKLFLTGAAVSGPRSILSALFISTGFMSLLFAMLFDMEESK